MLFIVLGAVLIVLGLACGTFSVILLNRYQKKNFN